MSAWIEVISDEEADQDLLQVHYQLAGGAMLVQVMFLGRAHVPLPCCARYRKAPCLHLPRL